jgi:hypothetical protein
VIFGTDEGSIGGNRKVKEIVYRSEALFAADLAEGRRDT